MRRLHCFASIFLLINAGTFLWGATPLTRSERKGTKLVAELLSQEPRRNLETSGVITIERDNGRRTQVRIQFQMTPGNGQWRSVYEAKTMAGIPIERFVVIHHLGGTNQYLLARSGKSSRLGHLASLSDSQTMVPFAGSDFWLADLGLEFFHWPEQRVIKHQMRRGRSCQVLESINPHPGKGGYSRVLSWIDNETDGLILAKAYGPKHRLLKEFSVRRLEKIDGRWQVKEMEIRNVQTDSRTLLEFDLNHQRQSN